MRFKIFTLLLPFIIYSDLYSQGIQVNVVQNNLGMDYMVRDFVSLTRLNAHIDKKSKNAEFYFLFENWDKDCTIQLKGKEFRLNRVNFNIANNDFISEIGKDSVFFVKKKYIDFIIIDGKEYKYKQYNGEDKFFEVLFEKKNSLSLYKGYSLKVIPKSTIGVLKRLKDEYRKEEKFYIVNNGEVKTFKLKKKETLKYIDKTKQNTILKYAKENRLSFKREEDLIKIFKYYNSL